MISNLDTLHQAFSVCVDPVVTTRHFTKAEVEKLTKLDGRITDPDTTKYPRCAMLKYQIGKFIKCKCGPKCDHADGFRLVAFGATWNDAVTMWETKRKQAE